MKLTPAGGALATPAASICASCVFGAYTSTVLSFTSHYISTIKVAVTPHIYVYNNGSRSTSYENHTLTTSAIVGGIAGGGSSRTYAKKQDITWTVGGATLTYPTSYVQFLGFSGAPAASDNGEICAETTDASSISLPEATQPASFIYALPANATALALPTPLLQYLGGLEELADQLHGASLTDCAPLDGLQQPHSAQAVVGGSNSSVTLPSAASTPVVYEQSSDIAQQLTTSFSIVPYPYHNSTSLAPSSLSDSTASIDSSIVCRNLIDLQFGEPTWCDNPNDLPPPPPPEESFTSDPGLGSDSFTPTMYVPSTANQETTTTNANLETDRPTHRPEATRPPQQYESTADEGVNVHTTAFVIEPITGQAVITYEPKPKPKPTNTGDSLDAPDYKDDPPIAGTGDNKGDQGDSKPTSMVGTGVTNLLDAIGQVAATQGPIVPAQGTSGSHPGDSGSGGSDSSSDTRPSNGDGSPGDAYGDSDPDMSGTQPGVDNLVGAIHSAAAQQDGDEGYNASPPNGGAGPPVYSAGHTLLTGQADGGVVVGHQTIAPGESITVDGNGPTGAVVALGPDGNLVIDGSTAHVLPGKGGVTAPTGSPTGAMSMALIETNGHTLTAVQSGSALTLQEGASSTTVSLGSAATFQGETILAAKASDMVYVNGNIAPMTAAEGVEAASQAVITAGSHTMTAVSSGDAMLMMEGSQTKTLQHDSDVVFQGQTISLGTDMAVVVNGHTSTLSSAIALATGQAVVTAGEQSFSALDIPGFVVLRDGSSTLTLRDGETARFEGEMVTAVSDGNAVLVDGQTMSMTSPVNFPTAEATISAHGNTFTFEDMSGYILLRDGTSTMTVKDGQTVTFEGQAIEALSTGNAIVINGRTSSLTATSASSTPMIDADGGQASQENGAGSAESSQAVGAASSEPTQGANAGTAVRTGGIGLVVACLLGMCVML